MSQAVSLRGQSEDLAAPLPPLLANAQHLASTVMFGAHGRRRSGMGDEFWQYRLSMPGDEARAIDWRRSARSDVHFVRQKEWQAAQSVHVWVDDAQSMNFASDKNLETKAHRARLVALATAILLIRAGERVSAGGLNTPPRGGELQLMRIAAALSRVTTGPEYGAPTFQGFLPNSSALFVSDFFGDLDATAKSVTMAADKGVAGVLLQVLDPQEEDFPFDGRTLFESVGKSVHHETMKASELRERYLQRLAERKDALAVLARRTGWLYHCHHTSDAAQSALLWTYAALEQRH